MNKNLTCTQVSALLNFYIEGKLNSRLREYFELHLEKCPHCKNKVKQLQNILNKYKHKQASSNSNYYSKQDNNFEIINKLSAYMDNELNSNESIKIKKMTIANPKARQELENLYKFQKAIHSAYERTKNNSKYDYSKNIMTQVQESYDYYSTKYFYKLAAIFVILLSVIIAGFIYLYF